MSRAPAVIPLGDSAITVSIGDVISEELNDAVASLATVIHDAAIGGVSDIVPSYAALVVHYDPLTIDFTTLRDRVLSLISNPAKADSRGSRSRVHRIPVRYDGEDLGEVAERTGLSVADIIRVHSEREYRVYVIGFVPGFAYLGTLDERLALPRRATPRKRVPAGSVAIADRQTAVYPSATPGGWHLIGTTAERLFDPRGEPPSILAVGDRVRFVP